MNLISLITTLGLSKTSYSHPFIRAFQAILPIIEDQFLTKIRILNLAGNNLTDVAVISLCDSLQQTHALALETLNLSDNTLSDDSLAALAELSNQIHNLKQVVLENVPKVSTEARKRLEIRLKKNNMKQ